MNKSALLSEEVQELIHYKPHWIIRKGNLLFFLLLLVVLTGTWFIRIPEAIGGSIRVRVSDGKYYGLMRVSRMNSDKIMAGQRVVMKPVGDVGYVLERVGVAGIADSAEVNVRFSGRPGGLPVGEPFLARAEVITGGQRLFDRWFGHLFIAARGGSPR